MGHRPAGRWFARFWQGSTIGQCLAAAGNRPAGFDYLRLGLAIFILFYHSAIDHDRQSPAWSLLSSRPFAFHNAIVPMFFAVSGFLVAGSLERTRLLSTFLGLRILRIFPALWADILFSAFLVGPAVTTLPLAAYFRDPEFHRYFLNLVGEVHYSLPGAFKNFPNQSVNGQLWTIPWELISYLLLASIMAFGLYCRERWLLAIAVASQAAFPILYYLLKYAGFMPPAFYRFMVVPCFLMGVWFYRRRETIPLNGALFGLCCAAIVTGLAIDVHTLVLLSGPIVYVAVFLGTRQPRRRWIVASGDYSYGIFLYHFQIQQTLAWFVPLAATWYGNAALSLPITFLLAFLSWHLIEKRALARKNWLYAREKRKFGAASMAA